MLAGLVPADRTGWLSTSDGQPLPGRVAWMDQKDLLLPWLRVIDNVTLGARLRGENGDRKRALALLASLGLAGREQNRPATLSGGERQRVALARTLLEDRPVVLMDEPFSALDAVTRHRLQANAAQLLAGRTVLLVTHDPYEALRLGHRIHVLSGFPARVDEAVEPPGNPPRDPSADALRDQHRDLLQRLGMHE